LFGKYKKHGIALDVTLDMSLEYSDALDNRKLKGYHIPLKSEAEFISLGYIFNF